MHYMVFFVLDNIEKSASVLDAWEDAGVSGITILESTGLGRMRKSLGVRGDFPLLPSIVDFLQSREERHRTFITVLDNEEKVDAVVAVTQTIVGDLHAANRGVIFVLPVLRAIGLANSVADSAE
jgi:nitrogen regulatory protein PII